MKRTMTRIIPVFCIMIATSASAGSISVETERRSSDYTFDGGESADIDYTAGKIAIGKQLSGGRNQLLLRAFGNYGKGHYSASSADGNPYGGDFINYGAGAELIQKIALPGNTGSTFYGGGGLATERSNFDAAIDGAGVAQESNSFTNKSGYLLAGAELRSSSDVGSLILGYEATVPVYARWDGEDASLRIAHKGRFGVQIRPGQTLAVTYSSTEQQANDNKAKTEAYGMVFEVTF